MIWLWAARLLVVWVTILAMEGVAALGHRFVMHGAGWVWHRSHHVSAGRGLEANDIFSLGFAILTIGLFVLAGGPRAWLYWVAVGVTIYGVLYAWLHEFLVHRRLGWSPTARRGYLARLVVAHHLHHATRTRQGAVSFGFLYAPPLPALRSRLRAKAGSLAP